MTDKPTRPHRSVASSETAREINRDILLQTIHRHQPVSRADLARLTGLRASTVSVIIGHLIEEGWVLPGSLGHLPRGRRPTFVAMNDKNVSLAIDLCPDHAHLAVVDINGKILSRNTIPFSAPFRHNLPTTRRHRAGRHSCPACIARSEKPEVWKKSTVLAAKTIGFLHPGQIRGRVAGSAVARRSSQML